MMPSFPLERSVLQTRFFSLPSFLLGVSRRLSYLSVQRRGKHVNKDGVLKVNCSHCVLLQRVPHSNESGKQEPVDKMHADAHVDNIQL